MSRLLAGILTVAVASLFVGAPGCRFHHAMPFPSPAASGYNTRDLIDPVAHDEADYLERVDELNKLGEQFRKERQRVLAEQAKKAGRPATTRPDRNILCLSGGGSYGAYSAGVLIGWSERGDRPEFDVVTGISTGALIAVPAFLGPKYDEQMKQFYTTVSNRDLFTVRPFLGLFSEAVTSTAPLAKRINAFLSPEVMRDLADAHHAGRRLYIGTTEEEGKQFIVWDVGAMAVRNGPGDRDLIANVLLGSTAVPGFFPSAKINVSVDGVAHTERHVDGSVTHALFFRPPYIPPSQRSDPAAADLTGAKVYVIVASKLFPDPEVIRPWTVVEVGKNIFTLVHAQARVELQRLYFGCLLTGMEYRVSAIPSDYVIESTKAEFKPAVMSGLFEEGRRVMASETPWRTTPPGYAPGESVLTRTGPCLTFNPRGPLLPIRGPHGQKILPRVPNSSEGSIPLESPGN